MLTSSFVDGFVSRNDSCCKRDFEILENARSCIFHFDISVSHLQCPMRVDRQTHKPPVMTHRKRKASNPQFEKQPSRKIVKSTASAARQDRQVARLNGRICSICFESKLPADFPASNDLPDGCKHTLNICRSCFTRSITHDIGHKPRDHVGCPECGARWDDYFLNIYAEPEPFAVFEALDLLRVLEAMPEFRYCLRPGCNGGQLHEGGEAAPIVTCTECGYQTCFTHRVAWHTGLTCENFDASEETETETRNRVNGEEKKLRETVRPCPRCNVDIEKDGGCDHMTCKYDGIGLQYTCMIHALM